MNAADDPTALLAALRDQLDAATGQVDELAAEVAGLRALADDLESLADILLDVADVVVLVVDADRRIRGLSAAAARSFEAAAVGKPLSSALPGDLHDLVSARLDASQPSVAAPDGEPRVAPLPGGGAVVVLGVLP
jgi:hypothetical protein